MLSGQFIYLGCHFRLQQCDLSLSGRENHYLILGLVDVMRMDFSSLRRLNDILSHRIIWSHSSNTR